MKLVKRILVATDFSPSADAALETTASLAKQFDSEVLLLHVIPGELEASSTERSIVEEKIAARLQERADQLRSQGIALVQTFVQHGSAFDEIDALANERDVNVILIGVGQASDEGQVYLGTTAGRLRRKAVKPVWVVRPNASLPIDRILCPIDFSEASGRALKNAIHLARGLKAELTVLSVIQSLTSYYDESVDLNTAPDEEDLPVQAKLREIDRFLQNIDCHDVTLHKIVRRGKPHREIIRLARDAEMNLIVMGSVGRTGFARILIGGVARKVAQQMPCSIITVRSNEPVQLSLEKEIRRVDPNFCALRTEEIHCDRFQHGSELLEQGFAEEALVHFQDCIASYDLCPRSWEGLAIAHERLGNQVAAQKSRERSERLEEILHNNEIVADVRENHVLFRSIFGVGPKQP